MTLKGLLRTLLIASMGLHFGGMAAWSEPLKEERHIAELVHKIRYFDTKCAYQPASEDYGEVERIGLPAIPTLLREITVQDRNTKAGLNGHFDIASCLIERITNKIMPLDWRLIAASLSKRSAVLTPEQRQTYQSAVIKQLDRLGILKCRSETATIKCETFSPAQQVLAWQEIVAAQEELKRAKATNDTNQDVCEACARYFVIAYGNGGTFGRLGKTFADAAKTHKEEIENGTWPGKERWKIPEYRKGMDHVTVVYASSNDSLISYFRNLSYLTRADGRVVYLAIFAHMRRGTSVQPGSVLLDEMSRHPENLGGAGLPGDIFASSIERHHFLKIKDSQVRLFGCFGGSGVPLGTSVAAQFRDRLGLDVYAFADDNARESEGTNDRRLGHGERPYIWPRGGERVGPPPAPNQDDGRKFVHGGDTQTPRSDNYATWLVNVAPNQATDFVRFDGR